MERSVKVILSIVGSDFRKIFEPLKYHHLPHREQLPQLSIMSHPLWCEELWRQKCGAADRKWEEQLDPIFDMKSVCSHEHFTVLK